MLVSAVSNFSTCKTYDYILGIICKNGGDLNDKPRFDIAQQFKRLRGTTVVRFSVEASDLSLFLSVQIGLLSHTSSYSICTDGEAAWVQS
jgi:hypothetical protein